ncbi:hypothetical protein BT96DRAFT_997889 [Gymnopus androsaceus JB14]|uniref:C2 domain-containing protein n=1 Tax=Gymnopus androsaceus JB14 TaxID=1447944 RepID=A0A6A4HCY5_9AGAR|nr:hypothetical protein BT96DRAFT_997889 [Gymnopus androsaceus JB14]
MVYQPRRPYASVSQTSYTDLELFGQLNIGFGKSVKVKRSISFFLPDSHLATKYVSRSQQHAISESGNQIGVVHVTIVRLHYSGSGKKPSPRNDYFANVTINNTVKPTRDKTLAAGWVEGFIFEIPGPCSLTIEVFRKRTLPGRSAILIGSYTENLEALLIRSLNTNITQPLPSSSQSNGGMSDFHIEFKVNLEEQTIVGAISAMVQRVKIQASWLAHSQDINDSTLFKRMQLMGDIPFNNIAETWDPLLEKLQIFANIADKVAEVHPYAKAAYSVISMAYKVIVNQLQCDANINCLILAMDDIYSFIKEAEPLQQIESHKTIMACLAQQTTECGYFITAYCADTFLVRAVKYAVSPVDAAITMYGRKFNELKSALLAHSTIKTEITVLRVLETVERLEMEVNFGDLPYASGVCFQSRKQCLSSTEKETLDIIINWVDDLDPGHSRIFILQGTSGSGNSAIANSVSTHYDKLGRLGSSIFTYLHQSESHLLTRLPVLFFPTIARDLADLDSEFRHGLWNTIKSKRALRKTVDLTAQYEKFILDPSTSLTISGPIVIVIDGLDDCVKSTQLVDFLNILAEQGHLLPPNFRILLTARNDSHILPHFVGNVMAKSYQMEDIDEWLIKCELSEVCQEMLLPCFTQEELDPMILELVERAQGSFRWAIETCKAICGNKDLHKALLVSPPKLPEPVLEGDNLYMKELACLFSTHGTLFSSQFNSVMGHLLVAYTPLSMWELMRLGKLDDPQLTRLLACMESLLKNSHCRYRPIEPIHASFYEFLGDGIRSKEFCVNIADYHFALGRACLQILNDELQFNMDSLTLSYNPESQEVYFRRHCKQYIKAELSYACRFWLKHLKAAFGTGSKTLNTKVQISLRIKLQYWCEILNLPGSVGAVIEALHHIMSKMLASSGLLSLAVGSRIAVLLMDKSSGVREGAVVLLV